MKSKAQILDDLRLGAERNFDEAMQTPFNFFRPMIDKALSLMSEVQRQQFYNSKPFQSAIEGIEEMKR